MKKIWFNERDVEVPLFLNWLERVKSKSFLDVGCHWAHAYYARAAKKILSHQEYVGIDLIPDDLTATIIDRYIIGDIRDLVGQWDAVACISMIEHCGVQGVIVEDYEKEQTDIFKTVLSKASDHLYLSFPFGSPGVYPGAYSNITKKLIREWQTILESLGWSSICYFFANEFPQGGYNWSVSNIELASTIPLDPNKGVCCVCVMEAVCINQ